MKNIDKYEKELMNILMKNKNFCVCSGEVKECDTWTCKICDFNPDYCDLTSILWLFEDDGEESGDYKRGMDDAYLTIKSLVCNNQVTPKELEEMFSCQSIYEVLYIYDIHSIKHIVDMWKEKGLIKVGDVLATPDNVAGLVIEKKSNDDILLLLSDGTTCMYPLENLIKTKRHINIKKIIEDECNIESDLKEDTNRNVKE